MKHYQDLVDLLNRLDSISPTPYDYPYRIELDGDLENYGYYDGDNEDGTPTGVIFIGEKVDIESEITDTAEDIATRVNTLLNMAAKLVKIKEQFRLDREFPQTED